MKSIYSLLLAIVFLLSGCEKEHEIVHEIVHEEIDLNNTNWAIHQTQEIPVRANGKNSELPIIWLGEEYFSVTSGCNIIIGLLKISDKTIGFTDYTTTLANCEGYLAMEVYLMKNLSKITSYKYSSGILYLYIGTKMIGSFKRLKN